MAINRTLIEIGICSVVAIASAIYVVSAKLKLKQAEYDKYIAEECAKQNEDEASRLTELLITAERKQKELASVISATDTSTMHLKQKENEAVKEYLQRENEISELDDDWCGDVLPSGVREAFSDYICKDTAACGVD